MVKTSVKFIGGAELLKNLNTLTTRVSKSVMRDALETAGEPMRSRMSQLAPREPGAPDLADNIVIGTTRIKGTVSSETAAIAIGPAKGFFYGFYQEFGTAFHGAQPFMRPAFDGGVMRAISDVARAMWTALSARGLSQSSTQSTSVQSDWRLL